MPRKNPHPILESLENRCLLSASPVHDGGTTHNHLPVVNVPHKVNVLGGSLTGIKGGKSITVSSLSRGRVVKNTYRLSPTAAAMIDGQAASLGSLSPGMRVLLSTGKGKTVTSVAECDTEVESSITAIDTVNSTLTLAGQNGAADVTYTIGATVPIMINGVAGALTDLTVGEEAEIGLSPVDGTTVLAVEVGPEHGPWDNGGHGQQHGLFGSVASVDTTAGTITVSSLDHWQPTQTTYTVSPTATITIDGKAGTLDQLASGVFVQLQTDPADATTVTSIVAVGKRVEGSVAAVDTVNNTITLAGRHGGAPVTYTLAADAVITVNGATDTLADVVVGSQARLSLSALDGATVIAVKAPARTERGDEGEHCGLAGTVASVDTTAGTITVSTQDRWQPTQTTYTVSPTATITIDGKAGTLDQLASGVFVQLRTDPASATTVTSIVAVGQKIEGSVTAADTVNNTITVAVEHGGTSATYTLAADAVITVNGVTGTLADVAVGSEVDVRLAALDATTAVSVKVEAAEGSHWHGNAGPVAFGMGHRWHR